MRILNASHRKPNACVRVLLHATGKRRRHGEGPVYWDAQERLAVRPKSRSATGQAGSYWCLPRVHQGGPRGAVTGQRPPLGRGRRPSVPGPPRPLAGTGGYPQDGLSGPCPFPERKAPRAWSGRNGQGPRAPGHRRQRPRSRERTTRTSQKPGTSADENLSRTGRTATGHYPHTGTQLVRETTGLPARAPAPDIARQPRFCGSSAGRAGSRQSYRLTGLLGELDSRHAPNGRLIKKMLDHKSHLSGDMK
jgi:hypothetical protein